jgi:branched-chain amino acid transport system substrate-binding protein
MTGFHPTRRQTLVLGAGLLATPFVLRRAHAQTDAIRIGSLTPNTGGGSPFGPEIAEAHRLVVDLVNRNGGVNGREIVLIQENSETNPEVAVRAARKLIDADRVIAILGTWSSSVTLGIMPLCQEANVLQFCTSSSESIPKGDAKGLVFDFQPLNPAWGKALARLALARGFDKIAVMGINNDFTTSMISTFGESLEAGGGKVVNEPFLYNPGQASYRAEVERLIADSPPAVFIPSYVTDFTAVYREIYRSGYQGQVITISLSTGPKFKEAIGEAANGILHGFPVPPIGKDTYNAYLRFVGVEPNGQVQNPFGCAGYDQANTLLLAIASAGTLDTKTIAEHMLRISNEPGLRVSTYAEGAEALKAGTEIAYDGASSSVDFQPDGMLRSRDFELSEIKDGKDVSIERITSES